MTDFVELSIDDVGAQGDGIVHQDGATLFVPGALTGERVRCTPVSKSVYKIEEILTPSPARQAFLCPHAALCGGCRIQHMTLPATATFKETQLRTLLNKAGVDANPLPVLSSRLGTRRRARLAAKAGKRGVTLGFNVFKSHELIDLQACPVMDDTLFAMIGKLRAALPTWLPVGQSVDLQLTLLPGGIDLVLIGGRPLDLASREILATLAQDLDLAQLSWRKWDGGTSEPVAHRRALTLSFAGTPVPFPPGAFLQATTDGQEALIAQACAAKPEAKRVLDLFCGLGPFGLSFPKAERVHFADLDGPAIAALSQSAKHLHNRTVESRNLAKEPFSAVALSAYDLVLFDPPRGGAKAQAERLALSDVKDVVAISCDPQSFARDAKILLAGGYQLKKLQPVDQFLFSLHLELVAHFTRG